ncbi:MAG: sulfatase family protein, partial [Nocardioidaceae bacterium]
AVGAAWRPETEAPVRPATAKARGGNDMNVVILVVDQTRADHVGAYGSSVRTPNIDALARSGTRFTRPHPESMPTVPVRRAIHTGLRSYPFRDWRPWKGLPDAPGWQPIPQDQTTLAEMLGQVGYTCLVLADTPYYMRPGMNFHYGAAFRWTRGQGFDGYGLPGLFPKKQLARYSFPHHWTKAVRSYLADALNWDDESQWPAARLYSGAAAAVGQLKQVRPFLLVIDTFEPHGPYFPPPAYRTMYGEDRGEVEPIVPHYGKADYLSEAELARMDQLYSGEITFTDRWMGRVLDALHTHGLADTTLVFLVSDHGVLLGEHNLVGKPEEGLYPGMTDIMLIARHPERGHGTTSDVLAATHDITPTVLANLDVRLQRQLDGGDMFDHRSAVAKRTYATSLDTRALWARDSRYTLIAPHYGAHKRLFDHAADPSLNRNIASRRPKVVDRLWDHIITDAGGHLPRYD